MLWAPWKEELGLFDFDSVHSYVISYHISDLVLEFDSLSMFRRIFTYVDGSLVVNRMNRSMPSWQSKMLA